MSNFLNVLPDLVIAPSSKIGWRIRLLTAKLDGSLFYISWPDFLRLLVPSRLKSKDHSSTVGPVKKVREEGSLVLWNTPLGEFWGRDSDGAALSFLLKEQLLGHAYQRGPVAVRSGDIVFDVGSHLGTFTRFALQSGARRVVAFEPESINIACFKRTFQKEILQGQVVLVEAAAWETPGILTLGCADPNDHCASGKGSVVCLRSQKDAPSVSAVTIDDVAQRLTLDRVDFLKLDIEGAERHAIRGGRHVISHFRPRMAICIYHRPDDPTIIPREVLDCRRDYQVFSDDLCQAYFC